MATTISEAGLHEKVTELAEAHGVPGVSVGVYTSGEEQYAYHGVTSVEQPLPVDETTLFQFGSTGKTFTATAMMRLADQGKVDLDASVRTYLPEFVLKDEDVAAKVTVLQLFNHTAGWEGDLMENTGDGDDALARYIELMADIEQSTPLGSAISYNNASLSVAGRIIEHVTGTTFEQAIRDLIFEPLGLDHCFFFPNEIMTRRFAAGHRKDDDEIAIARPWAMARGSAPAGGISGNSRDLITWARFHLGDGTAPDGTRLLSLELLTSMQQATATGAGALGDAVGISWFLSDVDGVTLVSHGGTTNGQHSAFVMVPERDLAVSVMTNCGPGGPEMYEELVDWVLQEYAGIVRTEPEAIARPSEELAPYVGRYETIAVTCDVSGADGGLVLDVTMKPHVIAQLFEPGEDVPDQPSIPLGFYDGERIVVTEGEGAGSVGHFVRSDDGAITGLHFGGRLASRSATPSETSTELANA